jgi:hypothetical protein
VVVCVGNVNYRSKFSRLQQGIWQGIWQGTPAIWQGERRWCWELIIGKVGTQVTGRVVKGLS